jgi:hypothetical protein
MLYILNIPIYIILFFFVVLGVSSYVNLRTLLWNKYTMFSSSHKKKHQVQQKRKVLYILECLRYITYINMYIYSPTDSA